MGDTVTPSTGTDLETWLLYLGGAGDPAFNMAMDEALWLSSSRLIHPVLRFYGWTQPAGTFGYSQKYESVAQWTPLRPLIRRPTGGGLVEHGADWTYSMVFPPQHAWNELSATASYQRLHEWQQRAFHRLGLAGVLETQRHAGPPTACFSRPEQHDLLIAGRKIAGAAQRRSRQGFLAQGSVRSPAPTLLREDWQTACQEVIRQTQSVCWASYQPDPALLALANQLAREKYSLDSHNRTPHFRTAR